MKNKKTVVIIVFLWNFISVLLQLVALWYASHIMGYTNSIINSNFQSNPTILIAFKWVLVLLISLNIVSLILSKQNLRDKLFLWFIGITYSAIILFSIALALLVANIFWNYQH